MYVGISTVFLNFPIFSRFFDICFSRFFFLILHVFRTFSRFSIIFPKRLFLAFPQKIQPLSLNFPTFFQPFFIDFPKKFPTTFSRFFDIFINLFFSRFSDFFASIFPYFCKFLSFLTPFCRCFRHFLAHFWNVSEFSKCKVISPLIHPWWDVIKKSTWEEIPAEKISSLNGFIVGERYWRYPRGDTLWCWRRGEFFFITQTE